MKLTRERKVYALILGLGGMALVADQVVGGPGAAMAQSRPTTSESAGVSADSVAPAAKVAMVSIRDRLADMMSASGAVDGRDAFQIDTAWREMLDPKQEPDQKAQAEPAATKRTVPGTTLPLVSMVIQDGAGGCAMIDGELVQVGKSTKSGVTLVGIERRAARLMVDGTEVLIQVVDESVEDDR